MGMHWVQGLAEGITAGIGQYNAAQKMAMTRELLNMKIEKYRQDQKLKADQRDRVAALFQDPTTFSLNPQQFAQKWVQSGLDPNGLKPLQPWMGPQAALANLKVITQKKLADPNTPEDQRRNAADLNLRLFGKMTPQERMEVKASPTYGQAGGGGGGQPKVNPEDKAKWNAAVKQAGQDANRAARAVAEAKNWMTYYRLQNKPAASSFYKNQLPALQARADQARDNYYKTLNRGYSGGGNYAPPAPTAAPSSSQPAAGTWPPGGLSVTPKGVPYFWEPR
jgi:hypothetical protein